MDKKISYLNRNFEDCRNALIDFSKKYYPDLAVDYNDASVASWMIDVAAAATDDLMYHLDRVYQETNIDSANEKSSLYSMARNAGLRVPGPKGAMAEVAFSCTLPVIGNSPQWDYAPIVRRGTRVSAGSQIFEVLTDVDFAMQFNENGVSDRTIVPLTNSNGLVTQYRVTKLVTVVAGETNVYKKVVYSKDVVPFMEIVLPEQNIMNVESVIVKDGTNFTTVPSYGEFYSANEDISCGSEDAQTQTSPKRYFEVESLAQQFRWDDALSEGKPVVHTYSYQKDGRNYPICTVTKGEWKPANRKFITEYTDNGYMKLTFGAGIDAGADLDGVDLSNASDFTKFQISRLIENPALGYLPQPNSTVFVLYRTGGGKASNVAAGAINRISKLNVEMRGTDASTRVAIKNSIKVESTTPSVSGKDMPTEQELKYLIKYNSGAQNRCVTVKDYVSRVLQMPPKYGTPFRVGADEQNNKIMLYLLGLDYQGHLDATLPTALVDNVTAYLSGYRSINDYVEVKSGKIINVSFQIDLFVDKNYNKSDVVAAVINKVKDYMDINKHLMGDDVFVGDIEKEISKVDGVINLINLEIWNEHDGIKYSGTKTSQEVMESGQDRSRIDLEASDGVLYSEGDTMLEIKYPAEDIVCRVKTR